MSDVETLERPAGIGHNSAAIGEMVREEPALIYRDEAALPALLKEIDAEIEAAAADVSTQSGRDALRSLAASISRRKTPIVDAGKALTEDWRKKTAAVNALKSKVEDEFDKRRVQARAPLTAWEDAEKARVTRVTDTLVFLDRVWRLPAGASVGDVDALIAEVEAIAIDADFGDSKSRASAAKGDALERLRYSRAEIIKAEEDRQELARLRAEQEERERTAREAEAKRIADEAEKARIAEAERRAAEEAERKAKSEAEAAIAEERRKAEVAQRALEEEQRRQREAKEAEDKRLADRAAELERRQKDIEHASRIMGAAKEALMAQAGLDEEAARRVVKAIRAGSIPSVTLSF